MKIRDLGCFTDPNAQAGLVYFAQRLDEMTRNYTLDSFKAPTVSIPVLIKECIEQIEAIDSSPRGVGEASAIPIIEELRARLVADTVHRRMLKSSRDLQSALAIGDVKTLLPKLRVLRSEISERAYVSTCMEMLDDAIRSVSKSNIEYLVREFVSVLQTMGVSRRHLHRTVVQHFFQGVVKSVDFNSVREFFSKVFPHDHSFTVLFVVGGLVNALYNDNFTSFGLEVTTSLPEGFEDASKEFGFQTVSDRERYLIVRIDAYDRHTAIERAEGRVTLLQNLYRIYNHHESFSISDYVLIEQCCEPGIRS